MAKTDKPAYISSGQETNPGLDYYRLRAEGIKTIQDLTGSFWTDYNEHDPGVTILEQLCYAITDLSYRVQFDVQDHLYNSPEDDTFLKAHEILPCNALTLNDYRKLIFDQVFELKNLWVLPVAEDGTSFRGLYKILIDVDPTITTDEQRNAVAEKTKRVFCNNRNICEDIEEIKILKPLEVEIFADVEVDGIREVESILAQVYYKVAEYLSPEIRFYSLLELIQEGYSLNEIFNGPLLKHGFIKTNELQEKSSKVLISEIIKIIMQVPGVISVKNLYLKAGDTRYDNQIEVKEDELPRLVTVLYDQVKKPGVHFFRGAVHYTSIDYNIVERKLNELQSANKRVYRLSEETISIPLGKKLNVENYFSIQNQFPLTYGVGQYGIPKSSDATRKAQVKQLKGYLLIYEQILANYLSQLSNAKNLFSLKQDVKQTYFYQTLDNVPDVKPLLKDKKHEFLDEADLFGGISLNYYQGLPQLVKAKDNYSDRRNRFLDYLLAIHGESYTQYSLAQFNFYFNEEEFERHLIQNKTRLLKSLSGINKNRARAFNYLEPSFGTENITGMEAKISILLGLGVKTSDQVTGYTAHSLIRHYQDYGLTLLDGNEEEEERQLWEDEAMLDEHVTDEIIETSFDYIDDEEVDSTPLTERDRNDLLVQTLPFKSNIILADFLKDGITLSNYQVGKVEEDEGKYYAIFKAPDKNWQKIGVYDSQQEANQAVIQLINIVKELNIQSEGLHIVEHILLRPDIVDHNHGVLIYDENRKPFLRSADQYSFEEREKLLKEIKPHLYDFNNYSVEATKDKDFEVHFKTPDGEYHFVSIEANISVEETHEKKEKLYQFISDQVKITPYEKKVGLYVKNIHSGKIIPEDFYSYRVSVMLPTWTARFSNKEFRSIVEDTIHEQKPANIALSCFWLSPKEMEQFESVYYEWMEQKRNVEEDDAAMDDLNNKLSDLLITFKDNCE